ncbi:hypothetical protein J7J18_06555 [bacterium]|nr:hypothetical protein [bacterium]
MSEMRITIATCEFCGKTKEAVIFSKGDRGVTICQSCISKAFRSFNKKH